MEKTLVDYIVAQRKEAEEFSKIPGNFMGMLPCHTDIEYWSQRVPSGTLAEFKRSELEETAYYMAADAMSKSYARMISSKLSDMTDEQLEDFCGQMAILIKADRDAA